MNSSNENGKRLDPVTFEVLRSSFEYVCGRMSTVLTERDSAWVDVGDDLRWIDGGRSFTWISERDGWRHLYVVSRDGKKTRLVTQGAFDLHNPFSAFGEPLVVGVDSAAGTIYYTASPENATQLYL